VRALGIVAALAAEARALGAPWPGRSGSVTLPGGVRLATSGVGCAAAARSAAALIDAGCGALASCGLAGGLDPSLAAGTLVVPEALIRSGGPALATSAPWRERIARALAAERPVAGGLLLTSERALETRAQKSHAFRDTGAAAVDMESYAVAEVARARGVPFVAVRVIVDAASDELPRAVVLAAASSGGVSITRLLRALAREPGLLGPLLNLAHRYHAARGSLRALGRSGVLCEAELGGPGP